MIGEENGAASGLSHRLRAHLAARSPRVHGIDALALAGILIGGYPIFKEALADLLDRRMTMELSMTIALARLPPSESFPRRF